MSNQLQEFEHLDRQNFILKLRRLCAEPRSLSQLRRAINLVIRAFSARDQAIAEPLEIEEARKRAAARWDDPKIATLRLLGHDATDLEQAEEVDGDSLPLPLRFGMLSNEVAEILGSPAALFQTHFGGRIEERPNVNIRLFGT
jgi:hypothetical protein